MKKISVIYWSGTGNTEKMAQAVAEGAKSGDTEVRLLSVDQASTEDVAGADAVAMGCPSMGAEVLEEMEMEPFVASIEGVISGKPVVLFGSYGWGNGEWMQDWVQRLKNSGANVLTDGLIVAGEPGGQNLDECRKLGSQLAGK